MNTPMIIDPEGLQAASDAATAAYDAAGEAVNAHIPGARGDLVVPAMFTVTEMWLAAMTAQLMLGLGRERESTIRQLIGTLNHDRIASLVDVMVREMRGAVH